MTAVPLVFSLRRKPWADVAPHLHEETGGEPLGVPLARQWSLVLLARGVPHRVRTDSAGVRLLVPARRLDQALEEIRAYVRENPAQPEQLADFRVEPYWRKLPGLLWSLGLVTVFLSATGAEYGLGVFLLDWHAKGGGDTGLMAAGQWWRAVTALCLHADVAHLTGNVVLGGVFLLLLAGEVGLGAAWFLFVASGALGNVAKVWLQGPGHLFLGASTAVFGALGVLAGVRVMRGGLHLRWRRALPFGAALMLLAMLGAGSEEEWRRIDLAGHFLGLVAGCALGLGYAALQDGLGVGRRLSPALGAAAAALVMLSWASALFS